MAMFDKFLRVGDYVINTEAIAYVDLQAYSFMNDGNGDAINDDVQIVFPANDPYEGSMMSLGFSGDDAEALRWLMRMSDSPQNLTDLWRNAQKSHHPDNKDRGHVE